MKNNKNGFTLIEILVYMAIILVVMLSLIYFFYWVTNYNAKSKALRDVVFNVNRALNAISLEIRESNGIYLPTTTSTQLSLETKRNLPMGEGFTYADFFICGDQLCLKRESEDPIAITSESVKLNKLEFTRIETVSTSPSIQIVLGIEHEKQTDILNKYSLTVTSTVSIRKY